MLNKKWDTSFRFGRGIPLNLFFDLFFPIFCKSVNRPARICGAGRGQANRFYADFIFQVLFIKALSFSAVYKNSFYITVFKNCA